MAAPQTGPLASPADDSPTAEGCAPREAGPMETVTGIMTARWRTHVIAARIKGVSREYLERELRQMATQLDALYQDQP